MISRRLRDLALETLIAVVLVAGLILWAWLAPRTTPFPARWVGLIVFTAVTFGDAAQQGKWHWHLAHFWLAFSTLLLAHSLIFTVLFLKVERWPLIWFVPVGAVEFPLLRYVLKAVGKSVKEK